MFIADIYLQVVHMMSSISEPLKYSVFNFNVITILIKIGKILDLLQFPFSHGRFFEQSTFQTDIYKLESNNKLSRLLKNSYNYCYT